ncbi:unnamed protein product [Cylindrotheca closterium]|uniref:SET domain-containing protein n=1 Tax=Cylindrotheca closterium TaxID=2856 RepID=A0AAD2FLI2_9STRA|nr:unnamed protein product [Cylindrotheca closterium]
MKHTFLILLALADYHSTTALQQQRQPAIKKSSPPIQPPLNNDVAFLRWIDEQPNVERSVAVQDDGIAGRGLVATCLLQPGQVAASIPPALTIRHEDDNENDNWAGELAAKLLNHVHRGPSSALAAYIEYGLPETAPTVPCRWDTEQLMQLQNATLLETIQQVSEWRHDQTSRHCTTSDDSEYLKYLDLVCSRTLKGGGGRQLVPLIDLANHATREQGGGQFRVLKDGTVQLLVGERTIQPGQAVTLDYGARNVDDFLLHYGFVPDRCYSDSVSLLIQRKEDDGDSSSSTEIFSWNDCQGFRGHPDSSVRSAARTLLESFPTSLEDDVQRLNQGQNHDYPVDRSIVSYRYAKKSMLASLAGVHQWS